MENPSFLYLSLERYDSDDFSMALSRVCYSYFSPSTSPFQCCSFSFLSMWLGGTSGFFIVELLLVGFSILHLIWLLWWFLVELLLGLRKVSCSSCLVVWAAFRDQGHDVVSFVFLFFAGSWWL